MPVNAADAAYEAQRRQRLQGVLAGMDAQIAAEDEAAKPKPAAAPQNPDEDIWSDTPTRGQMLSRKAEELGVDKWIGAFLKTGQEIREAGPNVMNTIPALGTAWQKQNHDLDAFLLENPGMIPRGPAKYQSSQAGMEAAIIDNDFLRSIPIAGSFLGPKSGERPALLEEAQRKSATADAKMQSQLPVGDNDFQQGVIDTTMNLGIMLPSLVASIATKNPQIGLAMMGAQSASTSYGDARRNGVDPSKSYVYGLAMGSVEVITERTPLKFLVGRATNTPFIEALTKQLISDGLGEQAATHIQDLLTWVVINPEKTFSDYIEERPDAIKRTAITSAMMSVLMGGAQAGLSRISGSGPDASPEAPPEGGAPSPDPQATETQDAPEAAPDAAADPAAEPSAQPEPSSAPAANQEAAASDKAAEVEAVVAAVERAKAQAPTESEIADAFEAEYNALLGLGPKRATVEQPAAAPVQDPATPGPQATPFRAIFGEQAPPSIVEQAQVQELSAATEATSKKYFGRKSFGGRGLNQTETQAEATPQVAQDATPVVDEAPALLTDDQITRIADRETVKAPEAADAESMLTLAEQNYDEVVGKDMLTALDDQFDMLPKQVRSIMDEALDGQGSTERFNTLMKRVAKIRAQSTDATVQEDFKELVAQQPEAGEGGLGRSFQSLVDDAKDPNLARGDHPNDLREGMTQRRDRLNLEARRGFGDWYNELAKTGRIGFVSSFENIYPGAPIDTLAVTDPSGRVAINDNVLPEMMYGLVLHEMGIHSGLGAMMGFRGKQAILDAVERLVQSKDTSAVVARERANRNALRPEHIAEETLAYLVQYSPRSPIVTRAIATMKVWLARRFPGVISKLNWSTADFRQLAILSVRHQAYKALELPVIFRQGLEADGTTLVLSTPRSTLKFGGNPSPRLLERVRGVIDLTKPQDFQEAVRANAEDLTDPYVLEALYNVHTEFDPFAYQDLVEEVKNTGNPDAAHDLSKMLEPLKGMDIPLDVMASRDEQGLERPVGFDDEAVRGTEPFRDERLTELHNRVVEKALNGFSNAEIAEIEDSTVDSVANMLSTARSMGIQIPVAAYKQAGADRIRIEELIDSGFSNKIVAERTGKTTNHVAQVRFQLKKRNASEPTMDDASRMARAKSLGFDTLRILYHGTPNPIQGDALRQSEDGLFGAGIYLTRNQDTAQTYAGGNEGSVIPLFIRGRLATFEDAKAARTMAAKQVGNVMGADRKIAAVTQQLLQNAGYAGVEAGDTVTMFDFKDVRSTEAKFDPRRDGQRGFMLARGNAGVEFETPGSPEYEDAVRKGLDMSTEARMARKTAWQAEKNTPPDIASMDLYHGTEGDFAQFTPSEAGTRGRGVYLTPDQNVANKYARPASESSRTISSEPGAGGAVMPVNVRGMVYPDESSGVMTDEEYKAIFNAADNAGKKRLSSAFEGEGAFPRSYRKVLANAAETNDGKNALLSVAGYTGRSGRSQVTGDAEVFIFDPKNIRSVNAAFDPSQTQSPNLMASRSDDTQSDMFDPYADPDVYVNLARIEGPEDFRALVQKLANESRNEVKQRVGPKQTLEQVEHAAARRSAFAAIMKRRKGYILESDEMQALEQLRDVSAEKVREISAVVEINPSSAAKAALHSAVTMHRVIQAEASGASADVSRLLGSRRIVSKSTKLRMAELNDAIESWASDENIDDLVKRIGRLGKNQEVELDALLNIGFKQSWTDLGGAWIRAMFLSNPKTHIINAVGNTAVIAMDVGSTYMGGALTFDQQMMSEAGVRTAEMTDAFYYQWRYMIKHSQLNPLKEGTSIRFDDQNVSGRQVDAGSPRALSSGRVNALSRGLLKNPSEDSIVGRTINLIGYGIAAPSEALGTADDMFKGVNYRVEMRALAWRQANSELRDGRISKDELAQRVEEIVEEPTEDMILAARKAAQERTFTNRPGPHTRNVLGFRRALNNLTGLPIGHLLLPFVITPSNIFSYTFRHLPSAAFFPEWRADYQAGGARKARAVGQVAMGTSVLLLGMALAQAGILMGSGPDDKEKRRLLQENQGLGFQPFSMKIANHTYTVDRLDPISSMLLIGAELNEIWANKGWDSDPDDELSDLIGASVINIGRMMLQKSYMTGMRDAIRALEDENFGKSWINRTAAAVSTPAVGAEVRRQVDPFWREADTAITSIKNRIPTLSSELPMEYDMFGRPKVYQSGHGVVYDSLMPFIAKKIDPDPIDNELLRLKFMPSAMERSLGIPVAGQPMPVSLRDRPDIYSRMTQLMGGDKEMGLPSVMDKLNREVQEPGYQNLMDGPQPLQGSKAAKIRDIITEHRSFVRQIVTQEYWGDLQAMGREELGRMMERTAEQEQKDQSAMAEATMRALAEQK